MGIKFITRSWRLNLIFLLFLGLAILVMFVIAKELNGTNIGLISMVVMMSLMGVGYPYLIRRLGLSIRLKDGVGVKPELIKDEEIEVAGNANMFLGGEITRGKLFLTNRKVIFKSCKSDNQTDISYRSIADLSELRVRNLSDNGVRVKTDDGKLFDFVVKDRDQWIEKFSERINSSCYTKY